MNTLKKPDYDSIVDDILSEYEDNKKTYIQRAASNSNNLAFIKFVMELSLNTKEERQKRADLAVENLPGHLDEITGQHNSSSDLNRHVLGSENR